MVIPEKIQNLIRELTSLPSIGPRQATRLAFHLVGAHKNRVAPLKNALEELSSIGTCKQCFYYYLEEDSRTDQVEGVCDICSSPERNSLQICIVEKETDMTSIESSGNYSGVYFILGSHLNENRQMPEQQTARTRLNSLKKHIASNLKGRAEEIVIGISPTSEGDITSAYLKQELKPLAKTLTRLARGIPTGGEVEFADEDTLGEAFKNRY